MQVYFNPAKHLYGRGWLGLIPLVGGFVGIGLILLGIFKYRDKKLILIGMLALSFTVALYGSLFYFTEYSETGRKQWAKFSATYLNNLVEDIEFYKTKNGSYPDSLEQLVKGDKLTPIYDPLLHFQSKRDKKFNYKRLGNKYILFSSGIDNIANTSDDIFPTITFPDSSKFGLIIIKQQSAAN